jgi:hypothetical protein
VTRRARQEWWRVVIEWKLDSEDTGTRYAYVTKCVFESVAIGAALTALADDGALSLGVGDTVRVLSCDPCAPERKTKRDELEEVP